MSSPRQVSSPPQDSFNDILARISSTSPAAASAPSSLLAPSTPQVSFTGEFRNATLGGDNDKGVSLVLFSEAIKSDKCCGYIGPTRAKFCTKAKSECTSHSKGGIHATSKFVPSANHFYVNCNQAETSAWTTPSIDSSKLEAHDASLVNAELDLQSWKALFDSLDNPDVKPKPQDVLDTIKLQKQPPSLRELRTPSLMRKVKFEGKSQDLGTIIENELEELEINLKLDADDDWIKTGDGQFASHMATIGNSMKAVLKNVVQNNPVLGMGDDITQDIEDLTTSLNGLKFIVGEPTSNMYASVWEAVEEITDVMELADVDTIGDRISSAQMKITGLVDDVKLQHALWSKFSQNWAPFIQSTATEAADLKVKFENHLKSYKSWVNASKPTSQQSNVNPSGRVTSIPTPAVNSTTQSGQVQSLTVSLQNANLEITSLKTELKNLEGKLNSVIDAAASTGGPMSNPSIQAQSSSLGFQGVTYNDFFFPNPEAVEKWLRANLSTPSHGMFVDIVSFSEFFGNDDYVERKSTLNEIYLSSKIGYGTIADSTVAASFQNILPGAYGRAGHSSSGSSSSAITTHDLVAQRELPGLPNFSKWDGLDGRTGRRYWIREEGRKTRHQLDGWIRDNLTGKAQSLAQDLLVDSFTMSETLYSFISSSYEDTMHSGRFDSAQAWALTCSFVKRIFTEIGYARVIARDGININDPWRTAGMFVFATLKAHVIMSEFMRLSIRDHPSISSEMVKFVCYTQPSANTSDIISRLSAVENLQRSDQSNVSKHDSRLKKVEAWKTETDKLVKKLKEKAGV